MASSNKKFRIEEFWPEAARARRWDTVSGTSIVPRRSLRNDRGSCENWLLPPEEPTGFEAVIQNASRAAGPVLLIAALAGGAWLAIG